MKCTMSSFFHHIKCLFSDKSDHVLHVNKQNGENVSPSVHGLHVKTTPVIASPKKGQKKEDGWKEVVRR